MNVKLQEFISTIPKAPPTLSAQLSNKDVQFEITISTQEIKGHINTLVNIPDVGSLIDRYKYKLEVLNEFYLSLKLTIEHKYGSLYSGLNMKER